jgi:hypothetical protein
MLDDFINFFDQMTYYIYNLHPCMHHTVHITKQIDPSNLKYD